MWQMAAWQEWCFKACPGQSFDGGFALVEGITVPHAKAYLAIIANMKQKQRPKEDDKTVPWKSRHHATWYSGGWQGKAAEDALLPRAGSQDACCPQAAECRFSCPAAGHCFVIGISSLMRFY